MAGIGAAGIGRKVGGAVYRKASGNSVSFNLFGASSLIEKLQSLVTEDRRSDAAQAGAAEVFHEAYQLAPEKTGEMVDALEIIKLPNGHVGVGIPRSSPAYDAAIATEYGAWNFTVGTPSMPKSEWLTKSKAGASMPWLRVAAVRGRPNAMKAMRAAIFSGNTRRPETLVGRGGRRGR